ncbi:hypothetical protein [Clostridium formicaceticum]|uniref:Uncharacterized protein n=1 Tax=Clostridium formicaceticum TaxID=1497 RepID=A0AAC9RQF4_9CLOT|nr:hypothetical protein [Clostridium formicaceticum]AOY74700.1 hypothetical protein BJL90_01260 [Clostridium formicaceticum]ARE89078.1 hypothetical protein CLFO_34840 [Clostridium formicaceticum]
MSNKTYNSYYYWENLIKKDENTLKNAFKDMPLTKESVFLHHVIVNCYGESYDGWIYFPNSKALLGFLQYIYLPIAYNTIFLGERHGELAFPMCTVEGLLEMAREGTKTVNKEYIPIMEKQLMDLKTLWQLDDKECIDSLKEFGEALNDCWSSRNDIFFYFNIFDSPIEVGQYIMKTYEEDEMVDLERIEEHLGVKREEWLDICRNLFENEFMKRKFVEILNNRIEDMI